MPVRILSSGPQDGPVRVKICGLTRPADMAAVAAAGAAYAGLVFFERSPRNVTLAQGRDLALAAPPGLAKVALVVDADDARLDAILATVPVDLLQLHGNESPARVAALRARHGLPVIKAVGIATTADLTALADYEAVADLLLVDAKVPPGATRPGGNALAFDWSLLAGRRWQRPWLLAGGLTPDNVATAVRVTGARQVDVSSGVEAAPGHKDPTRIAAFMQALAPC